MSVFDSKNFNAEVFGKYLETVPRVKQNALLKAGILRGRTDLREALAGEFDAYRTMQAARTGKDFEGVKPKFFETVYGLVDRGEGAKPLREQLACIRERYEEYFTPAEPAPGRPAPRVVLPTGGNPAPGARLSLAEAMRRANAGEQVDISQIGR